MSRRPQPQTLAAAGVLLVLALVAVLTAKRDAAPSIHYASTDFQADGYRAWAALLTREGVTTTRFVLRPIELDHRIDTLISAQPPPLETDPLARTGTDLDALAAWVRAGGRLVYLGRGAGLTEAETRLLALPFLLPDIGARGAFSGRWAKRIGALDGVGANRMLLVEHPGQTELADDDGDIVVRYPLGRGEIVATTDPLPFTNEHIRKAENARLAYLLGRPVRSGGVVAFDDGLHGALIDRPWYRALPPAVRVALGFGALALALGLAGGALPGIPPMRSRPPREPSSVEFVDALAALYARTGAREAARAILARGALAAAARGVGLADDAPPETIARRIEERGDGAAVRRLVRALDTPIRTDAELLASAKLAHLVWKDSLHDGIGARSRAAFAGRARTRRHR